MERAVKNYWEAEQECRALCEGKYENREFMDLYEAIASKWTNWPSQSLSSSIVKIVSSLSSM